jgi:hypothetical protein
MGVAGEQGNGVEGQRGNGLAERKHWRHYYPFTPLPRVYS